MQSDSPARAPQQSLRASASSFLGTTLEWYDFFIYGTTAALVFGDLFFPNASDVAGTLASFATLAVGFAARPLGGILFGHYGDRIGRKKMLVLSLLTIGVSTVLIGCLPTYDQIGVGAPVLLVILRLFQGVALGGEWGGAALMSIEHAPKNKRGLFGSATQMGAPGGMLLAAGAISLASWVSGDGYESWGWRLPFLASVAIVAIGTVIRSRVAESPEFQAAAERKEQAKLPIADVLREDWRAVLLGSGLAAANNAIFYTVSTYTLSYATDHLDVDKDQVLHHVTLVAALYLVTVPLFGALADRIGLRRQVAIAGALSALMIFPYFLLVETGNTWVILASMAVALAVVQSAAYAPQPAIYADLFPPRVRYTGASLAYAIPTTLVGGTAPFIGTALYAWSDSNYPFALYIAALGALAAGCALAAKSRYASDGTPAGSAAPEPTTVGGGRRG
ncbi:metabolite-proton symporter [Streptomyces zhaozhouensis]|uniref:Putative proline/betaine transporter n=1 Tax=Streptomyces zhaozhouensis TaxID=1300267 RepID=A0A286DK21_9ACTN|nr:MFS transporter [Streptomyces zhaozhouensis]SOD59105.1 metabolite-proton symporter [Streptomyces zhaozhouensis]